MALGRAVAVRVGVLLASWATMVGGGVLVMSGAGLGVRVGATVGVTSGTERLQADNTNSSRNSQTNAHHHRTLVPRVDRSQEKHVDEKNNKTGQHLARRRLR